MKILILTVLGDIHAAAVAWGLRVLGHTPVTWFWTEFLRSDGCSLCLNDSGQIEHSFSTGTSHDVVPPFDSIWYRRRGRVAPRSSSHPADMAFITREAEAYLQNSLALVGDDNTLWINHPVASRHADNKLVQLIAAREVGFQVPETLMTNDFSRVRAFYEKNKGNVIFKTFRPASWRCQDGSITHVCTTPIHAEHLLDEEAIRACPGIYQPKLDKLYELRVTVVGGNVLAAAIDSQIARPSMDWRYDFPSATLPLKATTLPNEVSERCVALCRKLNIVYGAIDIVVSREGDYVFLEINESGQFLWVEQLDPALHVLDAVCRSIAFKSVPKFQTAEPVLLEDFMTSAAYVEWQQECAYLTSLNRPDPICKPERQATIGIMHIRT